MPIIIATSNPHKREEIEQVWHQERIAASEQSQFKLIGLGDLSLAIEEPVEDQPTFEGNSALKARYYAKAVDKIVIADDSGLEVDALEGAPGVISARYAGVTGSRDIVDPANNALLIKNLKDVPAEKRSARFVCAMSLAIPPRMFSQLDDGHDEGVIVTLRGTVEGRIIGPENAAPRGENGFGYDPYFLIDGKGKTTAELAPEEKNAISHRGHASRLLWQHLMQLESAPLWAEICQ